MTLTFTTFKQIIPSTILSKGREYVRQGQIIDLTFDEETGVWEAQVQGTEQYEVRIEPAADDSLNCSCNCPYDRGPYCKHVAAVLYAIEEAFPDQVATKPRKSSAKRQTRHDKLRQCLEKTSREQLVTVLLELAEQDRELLNQLLIHLDSGDAKATEYRRVVKDALRSGRGEYGFLDYAGSNRAGRKLGELLTQAKRWSEAGEVERASSVYKAVIDETVPVMDQADDSDGLLGGCLSTAIEGLRGGAEQFTETGRDALFTFCLDRGQNSTFSNWDWGWELLDLAQEMIESPEQRIRFMSALEGLDNGLRQSKSDSFYMTFSLERVALLKLAVIDRFDGEAAADTFLHEHLHLDRLRMVLIERSIAKGVLDQAMPLIQEGITSSNQRHLPGLTLQYQALQVKLLQKSGDQTALVVAARSLWLDRSDREAFALLEQTVPKAEWSAFVEDLIKDIRRRPDQVAWLYAHENRWEDLLALIQSDTQALHLLEAYREPLETRFTDQVAALYEKIIDLILRRASGRNHYQQAVAYLRRIQKLKRSQQVEAIVQRLRSQYAQRPALLDELKRL